MQKNEVTDGDYNGPSAAVDLMAEFRTYFEPADNVAEMDELKTTVDIKLFLQSLFPEQDIYPDHLAIDLKANGYSVTVVGNVAYWQLKTVL